MDSLASPSSTIFELELELSDLGFDMATVLARLDAPNPRLSLDTTLLTPIHESPPPLPPTTTTIQEEPIEQQGDEYSEANSSFTPSVMTRRVRVRSIFSKLKKRASTLMRRPSKSTPPPTPRLSLTLLPLAAPTPLFQTYGASTPCLPSQCLSGSSPTTSSSSCDASSSSNSSSSSPTMATSASASVSECTTTPSSRWSSSTDGDTTSSPLSYLLAKPLPTSMRVHIALPKTKTSRLPNLKPAPQIPIPPTPILARRHAHPYVYASQRPRSPCVRPQLQAGKQQRVVLPARAASPVPSCVLRVPKKDVETFEHSRHSSVTLPTGIIDAPVILYSSANSEPPRTPPRPRCSPRAFVYPSSVGSSPSSNSSDDSDWSDPGMWLASSFLSNTYTMGFPHSTTTSPSSLSSSSYSHPDINTNTNNALRHRPSAARRFGYVPPHPQTPVRSRSRTRPRAYSFGGDSSPGLTTTCSPQSTDTVWHSACSSF
ncbi:hypothetical protein C8F01DRAFT_1255153 [Mycena amicta]|nr:hypothetical protein C8F01DRAFT_1255153 [Mycena amicta]